MSVVSFPLRHSPRTRGEVVIYPSGDGGGSWAVEHESEHGNSASRLATFLALDDAVAAARTWAAELGARFDEGDGGGGAAA